MKGYNHVSFECAKLLKDAGYPVIDDFYTEDGVWFPREMLVYADDEDSFFPAAQLWDVQRWLRDQIGIQAVVLPVYDEGNWRYLYRLVSKRGGSELLVHLGQGQGVRECLACQDRTEASSFQVRRCTADMLIILKN